MLDSESPKIWILLAVLCYLFFGFSLWAAIDAYHRANIEGVVLAGRFHKAEYPWHFFFACPVLSFLLGVICLYKAWRITHE